MRTSDILVHNINTEMPSQMEQVMQSILQNFIYSVEYKSEWKSLRRRGEIHAAAQQKCDVFHALPDSKFTPLSTIFSEISLARKLLQSE